MKRNENAFSQAFMKIFKTYDNKIIQQCMYYLGHVPLHSKVINRKFTFLSQIRKSGCSVCNFLSKIDEEFDEFCVQFNINLNDKSVNNCLNLKDYLWQCFRAKLESSS